MHGNHGSYIRLSVKESRYVPRCGMGNVALASCGTHADFLRLALAA